MINFVIALYAEAKPVIDYLGLKKLQAWQPFPIYASERYHLIVSGVGRCNSAAATAWLASLTNSDHADSNDVWLNLGIAGHSVEPLGKMMCCHKITEQSTTKSWYPVQIKSSIESSDLLTVDQVTTTYTKHSLHDMEASGFYATALRFTTSELAQCLKVVSDNNQNSIENINKELVNRLINDNLPSITTAVDSLMELSFDSLPPDIHHLEQPIAEHWRFSVTQARQLQRLLHRYCVIVVDEASPLTTQLQSENFTQASQVLGFIKNKLDQHLVELS